MQSQMETMLALLLTIILSLALKSCESRLSFSKVLQSLSVIFFLFEYFFKNSAQFLPLLIISGSSAICIFLNGAMLFYETFKRNKN